MTKLIEPDGGVLLFENQNDAIRSKKYDALGYATTYSYRNDKVLRQVTCLRKEAMAAQRVEASCFTRTRPIPI